MELSYLLNLFISVFFIAVGLMARYSVHDGWSALKKYWFYFIVIGVISLLYDFYKYFYLGLPPE
ncbi:Uncharacterised protein [Sphingobacterium spiritivorum]|uniref:Uncharacterized protein n=1 Tax=Sphingobacterium spiritivorum TaxID=258 RepID=A0A380C1H5_SPHSI|nr:Uncharacterised protein [Sphingobacterium spiritivorum]